jgi:hypothetical protein
MRINLELIVVLSCLYIAVYFSANIAANFPLLVEYLSGSTQTFPVIETKPQVKTNPRQMESAKQPKQITESNMKDFEIFSAPADGNCMFHSILYVLKNIGFEGESVQHLREIVAENVTEEQFQDLKLVQQAVGDYDCLNQVGNLEEFRKLILTRVWWGEQVSLKILKDYCKINFIVLRAERNSSGKRSLIYQKEDSSESEKHQWYSLLVLTHNHYDLACYKSKTVMQRHELPPKLLKLLDHFSETTDKVFTKFDLPKVTDTKVKVD